MTPWTLTHDVGQGDLFSVEPFWSPEKRAALRTVYNAWPQFEARRSFQALMEACPDYRHVEHKDLSYPTEFVPGSVRTLRDMGICHRLKYHGPSSFLKDTLDCVVPEGLPDRFAFVVPSTPKNGPRCDRWIRDYEWWYVIARLEVLGLVGLVVNIPGGKSTVPDHPRLIDWTGRTTLVQAVEVLKRAEAYIGVDSCLAVLATQLFPPERLAIRTNNPYVIKRPDAHYPPHRARFPFLYPRFDRGPHPDKRPELTPGTIVELRCIAFVEPRTFTSGDRVELDPERAEAMIRRGHAFPIKIDREDMADHAGRAVEVCGLEDD